MPGSYLSNGLEIRLFDPRRTPRDWTDVIGPTQCAVFLRDRATSVSRNADGKPFPDPDATTCLLFDRIDEARDFSEAKVRALPHLRCEIYDADGLAHSPLLVIVHPDVQHEEETGSFWSRRRRVIAVILFLMAPPLIWLDRRHANSLILPTFLAFNCILLGLRFLYWDFGVKHREKEREERLVAHRRKELGSA